MSAGSRELGEYEFLDVSCAKSIGTVIMRRPPVNAVNQAMYAEILELFSHLDELLPDAVVVILRGDGKHFSAGNDLGEFMTLTSANSPGRMKLVRETFAAIYDCPVPVIAAVHGSALGTGVALAGSCDIVICAESACFGTPEVGVGVMGAAKHLSRLVPQQMVRRMYYTADPVSGRELLRYGGVAEVVPDEELLDAATAMARRIARHSPVALRTAKESLNTIEYMELKSAYEFEQSLTSRLADSSDSREARLAIKEKRAPRYGR
ncbi:MAG TPA: enoyl-CoA hydratase-related protein [Solirubrobacteraceae bacterium]|nr:enoyl-CoA hydratase-related protein [Solirubrobacteraceae bacterium]